MEDLGKERNDFDRWSEMRPHNNFEYRQTPPLMMVSDVEKASRELGVAAPMEGRYCCAAATQSANMGSPRDCQKSNAISRELPF